MNNKQPQLTQNGKLFPSWILHTFKKYKLPIIDETADDICNQSRKDGNELREYQKFLWAFMNYESQYNSILLYHGVGSGKSASSINIYSQLYEFDPNWNVIILLPASLRKNWEGYKDLLTNKYQVGEIDMWIGENEKENKKKNIHYISFNAPNADKSFMDYVHSVDTTKKNLYIIDEAQKFISNVSSNISNVKGQRAKKIYDYIYKQKLNQPETRIILLSGTPIINDPFELALIFNLLRPMPKPLFPFEPDEFKRLFVDLNNNGKIKKETLNTFQRRILGLTSYYTFDPRQFAKEIVHYENVLMSDYQKHIYEKFDSIENQINKNGMKNSMYKSLTRQSSNFVFPSVYSIDGLKRPRPNDFKISEKEDEKIMRGKDLTKSSLGFSNRKDEDNDDTNTKKKAYKDQLIKYISTTKKYFIEQSIKDKERNQSDYIKFFKTMSDLTESKTINDIFNVFIVNNDKCPYLIKSLYECSPKYLNLIVNILKSKGPTIVYTNYVKMEGVEMIKIFLELIGFIKYNKNLSNNDHKGFRYAEFHGDIDPKERYEAVNAMNDKDNIYGDIVKIIFITSAGAEGISLKNIRQCHIMEPHWNESRIIQVIGRGNRLCSHRMLPINERILDVYRYKSIHPNKQSTDEYIEKTAQYKEEINKSFLNAIKEAAVDCELNYNINKNVDKDLKCFKFSDSSFLSNPVQAFNPNIYQDIKMNSGLNTLNSITKDIKVYKVLCKKQLNKEGTQYSKPEYYWLNRDNGYIYDLEFNYLIGQIKIENNHFVKDKNVFIINMLVPY